MGTLLLRANWRPFPSLICLPMVHCTEKSKQVHLCNSTTCASLLVLVVLGYVVFVFGLNHQKAFVVRIERIYLKVTLLSLVDLYLVYL